MRAVGNIQPQKTETHRTRLAAEGNPIDYPGEVSTPTSDLTTMKLHVNSVISDVKSSKHVHGRKIFLPEQPDG